MLALNYSERLMKSALNLESVCEITPYGGRKRRMNLNRTKIDIVPELYPASPQIPSLFLPKIQSSMFHYQLCLEKYGKNESEECFVLKTIEGEPFQINGQIVRESFVEKNDVVYIGQHRLLFKPKNYQDDFTNLNEHPCLLDEKLTRGNLHILIEGETGTGKSHLARRLHQKSERPGKFVQINLSSFSPNLIESELFGHTKGSFTGAINDKIGAFREAQYGTLFLDEIDSITPELQTKLLLFLDHFTIRPVGGRQDIKIETRLIVSTGKNLQPLVTKGLMRKDFYYRITSGVQISLEPIRQTPSELRNLLTGFCFEHHISISVRLIDFYLSLPWPGNIRQLRGHLLLKKELSKTKKLDFDENDEKLLLESSELREIENQGGWQTLHQNRLTYINKVLQYHGGKIAASAKILQITPRSLKRIIINEIEDK